MNVLAVGAHPLDVFFLCGGTLAKYARADHSISIAVICMPTSESPELPLGELAEVTEAETLRAAAVIGASVHFLGLQAHSLTIDNDTKLRVTELLRQVKPDLILTHDEADYALDHQLAGVLLPECSFMARQITIKTESPATRIESEVLFMDTISGLGFEPDEYVDITDAYDDKRRMMQCYESEIAAWKDHPVVDWLDWMEVNSRYRGIQVGVRYAEAFRRARKWGRMSTERLLP